MILIVESIHYKSRLGEKAWVCLQAVPSKIAAVTIDYS